MEVDRPDYESLRIVVRVESDVGQARRVAQRLTTRLAWSAEDCGRLALVVTEAGNNLLRHGGGGDVLLRACSKTSAVEVLALDKGPGIRDVTRCMEDGFSTGNSRGAGMGGMQRQANYMDVFSQVGRGTALLAIVAPHKLPDFAEFGVVCVAQAGESIVGDGWCLLELNGRTVVTVIDGLGHGPHAAKAARAGIDALGTMALRSPREILANLHEALRSTRGAAAAVADVQWGSNQLRYVGVGNISGAVFVSPQTRRSCFCLDGIVGEGNPTMREADYEFPGNSLLMMASDGLSTRWDMQPYPGLFRRHPTLIAGVLYRDFTRGRDDATMLVMRSRSSVGEAT